MDAWDTRTAGESAPPPLTLSLFGPLEVRLHGAPLPQLRSRKGHWLLALLVLRAGREVERSWLAGTLWPQSLQGQALSHLRKSLTDLRRALGKEAGRLCSPSVQTLALDSSGAEVDLLAFDLSVADEDEASLERAVGLYRGPLLEGCAEEWVLQERASREQRYLQALESLAAHARSQEQWVTAEQYLRQVVAVDPLRESASRALMEALASGGNYTAASELYRELRERLHRELNTEPDPETQALFRQLREEARKKAGVSGKDSRSSHAQRQADPSPRHPTPDTRHPQPSEASLHNLPLQLTRFIGRERESAAVKHLLQKARLLTLTGAGGCGKTRLALQVAAELLEEYADGVWLVELAALSDGRLVPQTVATALGVGETPGRPLTQTLIDALRPKQVLLMLDNCEHLLSACTQLTETLLQACPHLRMLATSREALGLMGEQAYRVGPLSLPEPQQLPSLERLQEFESLQLFTDRAVLGEATFALTTANAASVVAVCRRLDGIPLAIELAASRVKALPVEQIATRLDDRFRLLTGGNRTALPRQQTLKALIDWSYDLLSEAERALLLRLSVFAGGWTLAAAEAVGGDDERRTTNDQRPTDPVVGRWSFVVGRDDVLDLLASLVEKSLVLYEPGTRERKAGGEARYRLLETVRQYAWDRLQESGEAEAVRGRHRDWFLALAEEAAPQLWGSRLGAWLERLETDHDNFRAVLEWSGTHDPEGTLRLTGALWRFWMVRGYLGEGRERLEAALRGAEGRAELRRSAARAHTLTGVGAIAYHQGEFTEARSLFEETLPIYQELGDKGDIAGVLCRLGIVAYEQGDYAGSRSLHEETLAIQRAEKDTGGIAYSLNHLGLLAYVQGDYGEARSLLGESLAIRRKLGYAWGIAHSLHCLGLVAYKQGDYGEARSLFEESLSLRQEVVDKPGIPESLESLARVAAQGQEWERAARLGGAAAAVREAIGAPLAPNRREEWDRELGAARAALGEDAFAAAWEAGRALTLEQAIAFALDDPGPT